MERSESKALEMAKKKAIEETYKIKTEKQMDYNDLFSKHPEYLGFKNLDKILKLVDPHSEERGKIFENSTKEKEINFKVFLNFSEERDLPSEEIKNIGREIMNFLVEKYSDCRVSVISGGSFKEVQR